MRSFSMSPAGHKSSGLRLSICLILRIYGVAGLICGGFIARTGLLVCLFVLARELIQEVLMLIIRLGEVVDAGRIQRIEIIFRLRRVKRGADGIHAGVRDRPAGRPAFV